MITERDFLGCNKFKSKLHNGRDVIIVVGGSDDFGLRKAEVLDYTVENSSWQSGKSNNSSLKDTFCVIRFHALFDVIFKGGLRAGFTINMKIRVGQRLQ